MKRMLVLAAAVVAAAIFAPAASAATLPTYLDPAPCGGDMSVTTDDTGADDPTDDPAAEDTVADESVTTDDTGADDPTDDPGAEDTVTEDPGAGDTVAEDAVAEDTGADVTDDTAGPECVPAQQPMAQQVPASREARSPQAHEQARGRTPPKGHACRAPRQAARGQAGSGRASPPWKGCDTSALVTIRPCEASCVTATASELTIA